MPNEFGISLRLFHPSLTSVEMCAGICLTANTAWTAGELRRSSSGTELGGIRKESFAVFNVVEFGATDLAKGLIHLGEFLQAKHEFIAHFVEQGGRCQVYITGIIAETWGEEIGSELLVLMGKYGVNLVLDILPVSA